MAFYRVFLLALVAAFALLIDGDNAAFAQSTGNTDNRSSERLLIGVSVDRVPLQSDFDGTDIVVFGAIDDPNPAAIFNDAYRVVITVEGPRRDLVVRKKDRIMGVWANADSRVYTGVPSFYSVISNHPLEEIALPETLRASGIGVDNLELNLVSTGSQPVIAPAPEYAQSLRRLRRQAELFAESNRLDFLSPTLFRAYVALPAAVPIGDHTVRAYLFRNGALVNTTQASFSVGKEGFERFIFELAHEQSFLYGILAVILAIVTGYTANVMFKKD